MYVDYTKIENRVRPVSWDITVENNTSPISIVEDVWFGAKMIAEHSQSTWSGDECPMVKMQGPSKNGKDKRSFVVLDTKGQQCLDFLWLHR